MMNKDKNQKPDDDSKVQHTYHDHANDEEEKSAVNEHLESLALCRHADQNFTARLHRLLSCADNEGISHIVSWQPHGRSFLVHKKKEFEDTVMPRWFSQSNLSSFLRQLNLYGFMRQQRGPDKGGYYHELFLRGKPMLCRRIERKRIKGRGARKAVSHETEPDFYKMTPLPSTSSATERAAGTPVQSQAIQRHPRQALPFPTGDLGQAIQPSSSSIQMRGPPAIDNAYSASQNFSGFQMLNQLQQASYHGPIVPSSLASPNTSNQQQTTHANPNVPFNILQESTLWQLGNMDIPGQASAASGNQSQYLFNAAASQTNAESQIPNVTRPDQAITDTRWSEFLQQFAGSATGLSTGSTTQPIDGSISSAPGSLFEPMPFPNLPNAPPEETASQLPFSGRLFAETMVSTHQPALPGFASSQPVPAVSASSNEMSSNSAASLLGSATTSNQHSYLSSTSPEGTNAPSDNSFAVPNFSWFGSEEKEDKQGDKKTHEARNM